MNKGQQVQQMGSIYRAERVIIWLGEATYNTDYIMYYMKQLDNTSNSLLLMFPPTQTLGINFLLLPTKPCYAIYFPLVPPERPSQLLHFPLFSFTKGSDILVNPKISSSTHPGSRTQCNSHHE